MKAAMMAILKMAAMAVTLCVSETMSVVTMLFRTSSAAMTVIPTRVEHVMKTVPVGVTSTCGDGRVCPEFEACDDGNNQ